MKVVSDNSQTRTLELPTDSTFAVAMRNQQAQEREEQQRIKNLVLNLDLRESDDPDGEDLLFSRMFKSLHTNLVPLSTRTQTDRSPLQPQDREACEGPGAAGQEAPI